MPAVVELKPGTPDSDVAEGFRFVRQLMESDHKQTELR
jgi:hypothetical protein